MKHLSENIEHSTWDAIQNKNTTLVFQAVFKGIDLDMKNRWGDTFKSVLAKSKIWHGRLLSDVASSRSGSNSESKTLFQAKFLCANVVAKIGALGH